MICFIPITYFNIPAINKKQYIIYKSPILEIRPSSSNNLHWVIDWSLKKIKIDLRWREGWAKNSSRSVKKYFSALSDNETQLLSINLKACKHLIKSIWTLVSNPQSISYIHLLHPLCSVIFWHTFKDRVFFLFFLIWDPF